MPDVHSAEFQRQFVADLEDLQRRHGFLRLEISFGEALTLVGQLQLALRHPGNAGNSALQTRRILDQLIATLGQTETLRRGLRAGDDPACDVPMGPTVT